MFLREIKVRRKSGKVYSWYVVIKTYWDKEKKKVRHRVIHNLGHLSEEELKKVKLLLSLKDIPENSFFTNWENIKTKGSYDYLLPIILDRLWRRWELDKIVGTGQLLKVPINLILEILTISRAIHPTSDRRVCDWYKESILPMFLKVSADLINPTRIYRALDSILEKEEQIQENLAERIEELGFDNLSLIFYDITSSYFEGNSCSLAEYGQSRDKRKDKKQLLLGLAITKQGYPFYWKVLPGSLHDSLTVKELISCLKERFNLKNIIVIMDKGMVSEENLSFLEENNFWYIVTIKRNQIQKLSDFPYNLLKEIQEQLEKEGKKEKSDLKKIMEKYPYFKYFSDRVYWHQLKSVGNRRYILCFNPDKFLEEREQRQEKIKSIQEYLIKWNKNFLSAKSSKNKKQLEKEIYSYLKKRKAESWFIIKLVRKRIKKKITTYQIEFDINQKKLDRIKIFDGIYCILTNLPEDKLPEFLITAYRERRKIENAFHYLKGFIEIRPFYHQKEERIKAHILVCILGYLLQITLENLLKNAGYNITFQEFYQKINKVKAVQLEIENTDKKGIKLTDIDEKIIKMIKSLNMEEIITEKFLKNMI